MSLEQVHSSRAELASGVVGPLRAKQLVLLAVLVITSALAFGLSIVRLYYANDLDAVPLSEVGSGAHDPKDLPVGMTGTGQLLGYFSILLVPFTAGIGALLTGVDLVESLWSRRPRRALAPGAAVLTLCVATLVGYAACGPLVAWWMD